ncbi:MAG: sulfur carrier protein ThiS [Acidobacteriota bacterium]|nr:sulfur carrier protein ThiS [Acidobacteriota bacterium]
MSIIEVTVNGEQQSIPPGQTILQLLKALAITPDRVAVELDRAIVRKAQWSSTEIQPGAHLEIVHFVGGG